LGTNLHFGPEEGLFANESAARLWLAEYQRFGTDRQGGRWLRAYPSGRRVGNGRSVDCAQRTGRLASFAHGWAWSGYVAGGLPAPRQTRSSGYASHWMGRLRTWARTLVTLNGSPRGIALGFCLGLSLSLVPVPFAGMVVALALAPVVRANLPATYLGSAVVNPATGPFIYFAELWIGTRLVGARLPPWASLHGLDTAGWWEVFGDLFGGLLVGVAVVMSAGVLLAFPLVHVVCQRVQRSSRAPAHDARSQAART
jgi:uncharacterized protein (DUF2062 family)